MKTFKDLKFEPHAGGQGGMQSKLFFPNGYGVSVVRFTYGPGGIYGFGSYTNDESEWELAVLKGDKDNWDLTYDTPITDDVMGHLQEEGVTEVMKRVQELEGVK